MTFRRPCTYGNLPKSVAVYVICEMHIVGILLLSFLMCHVANVC